MSNYSKIDLEHYSEIFSALSNPHRLKIFKILYDCHKDESYKGTMADARTCMSDMSKDLNLAPSTVSHHFKELRRANLITMERKGKTVECAIKPDIVEDLSRFFSE
jgi:ArsR family transcriptional regulator, arsenate/arsenite/antimonite-responsive transcriptional repressor